MDYERSALLERAQQARAFTAHIDSMFHTMPWAKDRSINLRKGYWELLSFLYASEEDLLNKSECTRRLSGVMSQNTAEQQLKIMITSKVLETMAHPFDKRVKVVSLSKITRERMDSFFKSFQIEFEKIR